MENKHSRTICPACGTAPVNHSLFLFGSLLHESLGRSVDFMFGWIKVPYKDRIADALLTGLVRFFALLGLVKWNTDIEKSASGRSKLIWEEAFKRGIHVEGAVWRGKKPLEIYRAKINGKKFYYESLPIPTNLRQDGYAWVDDKEILAKKLLKNGLRAPEAHSIFTLRKAKRLFKNMQKPVIIKPRSGSRGRHTTTNIKTAEELETAFKLCKQIALDVVMESHLFGSVYRATVINGKLVGFFRADPPQIVGDGTHTGTPCRRACL